MEKLIENNKGYEDFIRSKCEKDNKLKQVFESVQQSKINQSGIIANKMHSSSVDKIIGSGPKSNEPEKIKQRQEQERATPMAHGK